MLTEITTLDQDTAAQILAVQLAAYTVESELIGYAALPPLRETVDDILNSPEQFLVYRDGKQIVAVLSYERIEDRLDIGRLVVSPSHFRRGVASQLLVYLEQLHPTYGKITVSTAAANRPAIALYEKHGFHIAEHKTLADGLVLVQLTKKSSPTRP